MRTTLPTRSPRARGALGLVLPLLLWACQEVGPTVAAVDPASLIPRLVQLLPRDGLPALTLDPAGRELLVVGGRGPHGPLEDAFVVPITDGMPLAMLRQPSGALLIATRSDAGRTLVRRWTWHADEPSFLPGEVLFSGSAGTVTDLALDDRSGSLILLDGEQGRLLEVIDPRTTRTLASTDRIPQLIGMRSLEIHPATAPSTAATLVICDQAPDSDVVHMPRGVLELTDRVPGDGLIDDWQHWPGP